MEVAGVDGDVAGELGSASVAGGAEEFGDLGGFAKGPEDGVFATASADDENLHRAGASVGGTPPSLLPARKVSGFNGLRDFLTCKIFIIKELSLKIFQTKEFL